MSGHRLVTVGDSLTQGFHNLAIFDTDRSWPAMVARQLGVDPAVPHYPGPGGYPLNLEELLRVARGGPVERLVRGAAYVRRVRGAYSGTPASGPQRNENLGIFGWDLRDTLDRDADLEAAIVRRGRVSLSPLVPTPGERAAVVVLDSERDAAGRALTPLRAAQALGEQGGIETLCVWLGSNNALQSVIQLKLALSGPDYRDLERKKAYTVWRPEHFRAELRLVAEEVRRVDADHVLWGTVPHVTIPPITRGLGGPLPENPTTYFRYYARPWQTDATFRPRLDAHLTGLEAWTIDIALDAYNDAIRAEVERARADGFDWRVVDLSRVLDRLAVRRNDELGDRPADLPPYPLPPALAGLTTEFLRAGPDGRILAGGLIGLDGIHPTTAGYGLVAQEVIDAMVEAGVDFDRDGGLGSRLDFARVRDSDTLLAAPPTSIDGVFRVLRRLEPGFEAARRLLARRR